MRDEQTRFHYRDAPERKLNYRTLSLRQRADGGGPETLDPETRSVEVVGATEAPVEVYDWDRGIISEILRMDGMEMPASRQVPLLDAHWRGDASTVLGSYRGMTVAGNELTGRAYFSTVPEAEGPYTKVREGHLTDFSIGYRVLESEWIPSGETATVNGKRYKGPLKVTTRWVPHELSVVPIGADQLAKARAEADTHNLIKEENMDKKLRELLEKRGLPVNATEDEAWAYLDKLTAPDTPDGAGGTRQREPETRATQEPPRQDGDPEEKLERAIQKERERVREINALCARFDCADLAEGLVGDGATIAEAQAAVLKRMEEKEKDAERRDPGFRPFIEMGLDERDKFRAAAVDSIILRGGEIIEEPAPGAMDLRGFSLRELARECLRIQGKPIGGDPMEMVGRAMTTDDFPYILADSARKSLFAGYETADETWRTWCAVGSASDFKDHSIVRAGEFDDLDEVPEHGEYNYGERTEAKETYSVATYGKLFAITRQTIINDDLAALTDVPRGHGEAAARKVGDLPYAVLTANAAMGDGVALFHSSHGNLGTAGAPSETTIAEAIKLMKLQKDLSSKRRLNIRARYFIAPAALEGTAEIFFNSIQYNASDAAATRNNPYAGNYFTRVYDARLDDDSSTAYYLAGPTGKTVTVFFLNGNQKPYLETKQGWTVDGVEYKVRIDAGAKAVDWRALVKNAGA